MASAVERRRGGSRACVQTSVNSPVSQGSCGFVLAGLSVLPRVRGPRETLRFQAPQRKSCRQAGLLGLLDRVLLRLVAIVSFSPGASPSQRKCGLPPVLTGREGERRLSSDLLSVMPLLSGPHSLMERARSVGKNKGGPHGGGGHGGLFSGRSGRQNAATRRNMRRERVTVQAPVKK